MTEQRVADAIRQSIEIEASGRVVVEVLESGLVALRAAAREAQAGSRGG